MKRRTVLAAASAAAVIPVTGTPAQAAGWQLRWAPEANVHGLGAFEGIEDDRANSHPAGRPHIFVPSGSNDYRFNMHMVDRDSSTDRQRQEVKGMVWQGSFLNLQLSEAWKLTHSMYIPTSLKATTSFTHIMQTKAPGTGTLPMLVMSLRRHSGVQKIELVVGGTNIGTVDLVPVQNKWIDVELEMTIGNSGRVRWVLRDGATTLIDVTRTGVDNWLEDRVRPKWGIYRSLGDTSGSLQDCHMMIRNMRCYKWTEGGQAPPVGTRYEAESAVISQGVVESNHAGFTGTGFVNLDNIVGSYVQWNVNAASAGLATLTFRYANGTTANRPMDIQVNGQRLSALAFGPTPAWNDWDTLTLTNVAVNAGNNVVRATSTTSSGGPNLDNLEVQVTSGGGPREHQAESAVISQGAVESNHAGFTGTGFVNLDNVTGSYVEFTVSGPATNVAVRYANGTTANRPMSLNGAAVNFPGTGAWTSWATANVPVSLGSGSHTLRLTSSTSNGGPNLDKITLS